MHGSTPIPHALERADHWIGQWRTAGRLVLLLDFDGTLAPIVERPELASIPPGTRLWLERLVRCPAVDAAVVSGRALADARARAQLQEVAYAGNHGMEIEAPGVRRTHPGAEAARPRLRVVRERVRAATAQMRGVLVEDKLFTLSVHHRMVAREQVPQVVAAVEAAVREEASLRLTRGKEVLEVRPAVNWHKGRAVEFLLSQFRPCAAAPVLYIGDDATDEDAFRALLRRGGSGEGVIVADPVPTETAARAYLRSPGEVGVLLEALAERGPC